MISFISEMFFITLATIKDVLPIVLIIFGFQFFVIKRPLPNLKKVVIGIIYVILGLSFFLVGLEEALFPLGRLMAQQLTDPAFIRAGLDSASEGLQWSDYTWVYEYEWNGTNENAHSCRSRFFVLFVLY